MKIKSQLKRILLLTIFSNELIYSEHKDVPTNYSMIPNKTQKIIISQSPKIP